MRNGLLVLGAAAVLLVACAEDTVEWGGILYRPSRLGDPDARSSIMSANLVETKAGLNPCLRSIRAAGDTLDLFRVWWSSRHDSSVVLSVQRSKDRGRTWLPPMVIDSVDRGRRGCDRPPPATAFDPSSGYLYLVYFIEPSTGAGVFFAHSMDRADMFHAPVPVIYGTRASAAGVAGRGDSVVVVFEDPNSSQSRVGYALSHTSGHIFEKRGQVTPNEEVATAPWVNLKGNRITVSWKSGSLAAVTGAGGFGNRAAESSDRVGVRNGVWK
ncbi:MAG: hypothetical protein M3365_01370 [Gemmatimonadota bacterium]|nr:hypothetical protein [Gemmatimonadota bacterium]